MYVPLICMWLEKCLFGTHTYLCVFQNAHVEFTNNIAGIAGAAIYANDMSRCKWLGPTDYTENYFIFNTPTDYKSPFLLRYDICMRHAGCQVDQNSQ